MKILVTNNDWTTKPVTIKNRTVRVLKTGKVIPTELAMFRRSKKI